MKGFVEFIIVSIMEVEIEILSNLKNENNPQYLAAIEDVIESYKDLNQL